MRIDDEGYDEYRREIVNKSQRKRREKARKMGLCCICCLRPARPDKKTCVECNERSKAYNKSVYVPRKGKPGRPKNNA